MPSFTAHLQDGRLVVDDPSFLGGDQRPLTLVIDDEGDDLDEEERGALNALLDASELASARGETRPAAELVAALRARRGT